MADTKFEMWLEQTEEKLKTEHYKQKQIVPWKPLTYKKGKKFVKILSGGGSVWGFVSMFDGYHDQVPVKVGDLLKPASWSKPARHSRGNIFSGTAVFSMLGPAYLK
jgi:hypothetical protein